MHTGDLLLHLFTLKATIHQVKAFLNQHIVNKFLHRSLVILAAVKSNGYALEYASPELRNNKDVVMTAVQNDGHALQFASEELRSDIDVVLAAVQRSGDWMLEYTSKELREYIRQNREKLIG